MLIEKIEAIEKRYDDILFNILPIWQDNKKYNRKYCLELDKLSQEKEKLEDCLLFEHNIPNNFTNFLQRYDAIRAIRFPLPVNH